MRSISRTQHHILHFAVIIVITLILTSCDILNPQPPVYQATPWFKDGVITDIYSNTTAADLDINNFLYSGMLDMYLWRDSVPNRLQPSSFTSPDTLLFKTMAKSDRFTFIEKNGQAYLDQLTGGSVATPSYGFGSAYFSSTNLRIARVIVPSPAYQAGLRRGMKVLSIDGKPVPTTEVDYGNYVAASSTLTFEVEDSTQTKRTITMMRGFYTPQAVTMTKILNVGGKKVGYLMLNSYTGNVATELTSAFQTIAAANPQEMVVDLRYNGGGFVNAAGQLCGLLSGQLAGTPYVQYTYNTIYKSNNRSASIQSLSNALRLARVFFLVNGSTASASELTINALKPFVDVVIIGTPTVGKAVGSHIMFHTKSGYILQPISFKFANARGEADFLNGFTPTRTLADPTDRDFGDPQETYLRQALLYIQNGSFPALSQKERAAVQSAERSVYVPEQPNEILPALAPITRIK